MRTMRRGRRLAAGLAGAALVATMLSACEPNYTVKRVEVNLAIPCNGGTTNANTEWAIPEGVTPTGFIWLQHGFSRSNDALIDLQTKYASRGWIVASPSLSSFGTCAVNSATLHGAVASLIAGSTSAGSPLEASYDVARGRLGVGPADLPANVALSGHSAGGAMVTVVGGSLASNPSAAVRNRFKGIVLLDPVENGDGGMAANLPKLGAKPVLTVSAPNSSCNSNSSGTNVLRAQRSGFVGVRMPSGCHCDAEANSTDTLCTLVCGTPQTKNEDALKRLAADWISDMLSGKTTAGAYPGGEYYEQTRTAGTIVTLTGTA
jgi:hypothetical protein